MNIVQNLDYNGYKDLPINQKINVKAQNVTVTSTCFAQDYNHYPYYFIAKNDYGLWTGIKINEDTRLWFNEQSKTEKKRRVKIRENKQKRIKR